MKTPSSFSKQQFPFKEYVIVCWAKKIKCSGRERLLKITNIVSLFKIFQWQWFFFCISHINMPSSSLPRSIRTCHFYSPLLGKLFPDICMAATFLIFETLVQMSPYRGFPWLPLAKISLPSPLLLMLFSIPH